MAAAKKTPYREETLDVNPKLAEEWLNSFNTHNREIRNADVDRYADDMRQKNWQFNAEPIRFDWNGVLIDGQHRLWAIIESGCTIKFKVVWGLDPSSQNVTDVGRARTLADLFKLNGESNWNYLAAAVRVKWRLDSGNVRFPSKKPSNPAALATLERNPGLRDCIRQGMRLKRFHTSVAIMAVCFHEFSQIDAKLAETMYDRLNDGINLVSGSPIYALRRWMERQQYSRAGTVMTHALFIKCWNALRDGRHVANLTWRTVDEEFPTAR